MINGIDFTRLPMDPSFEDLNAIFRAWKQLDNVTLGSRRLSVYLQTEGNKSLGVQNSISTQTRRLKSNK